MKLPSLIAAASLSLCGTVVRAADATAPIDYSQRNAPFAPAAARTPEKKDLPRDTAVQNKRVAPATVEKQPAAVGERRAPISLEETRGKNIREKNFTQPTASAPEMSTFNHREAAIATSTDTQKPPTVAKYQDSLATASASNMARFPAIGRATTAKINRFVFRKNSPDSPVTAGAPVVPAAGGSPVSK